MTVEYASNAVSYAGNGATTAFAVPFNFLQNAHLVVNSIDSTGLATLLTYGVDYTATGAGNDAGGTVTMTVAPAVNISLSITRNVPVEQLSSFPLNGSLPSKVIEQGLDYLTMIAQQFNSSINVLNALLGAGGNQQPDVYQLNASVLLLRGTIQNNVTLPVGYNGMAIFPTIALGVVLTIPVGSVFTTLDPNSGLGNNDITLAGANNWMAQNAFGVQSAILTFRLDPTYGDGYISRSGALANNPISGEQNGWAADITLSAGSASVVPIHGHAISAAVHTGNAFGAAFESYVLNNKSGGGLVSKAIGCEADSIVMISNSSATQHLGFWAVFKNRLDIQSVPVNGVPAFGGSYNANTAAFVVDALARGGNTSIECGWQTGLRFNPAGMDSAAGVKAIGIDLTPLDAAAPEGGKYYNRMLTGLALPDNLPLTLSTNKLTAQMRFSDVGTIEFNNNGSQRVMIGLGNSTLFQWDGINGAAYTWYIDTAGDAPAIMRVASGLRTIAPVSPTVVANWIRIIVDSTTYSIPLYA
jgi:hypothetical protein